MDAEKEKDLNEDLIYLSQQRDTPNHRSPWVPVVGGR